MTRPNDSTTGRRLAQLADAAPVLILAAIAGAGSFVHIRDTAAQHGQHGPMSLAIAISASSESAAMSASPNPP